MKETKIKEVRGLIVHHGDVLIVEVENNISQIEMDKFTMVLSERLKPYGVKCMVLCGAKAKGVIRPAIIKEVKK